VSSLKTIANEFVITLGSKGALLYDGSNMINIDATETKAIDTNGAGDMFAGAYLYGITHGYTREQAGKLASAAAAKVVSQYGPRLKPEQHQEIIKAIMI
jgi:sugar/nucleoside kinase (ribokinase family)